MLAAVLRVVYSLLVREIASMFLGVFFLRSLY